MIGARPSSLFLQALLPSMRAVKEQRKHKAKPSSHPAVLSLVFVSFVRRRRNNEKSDMMEVNQKR
jgi:hypothetical protein